MRRRLRLSSVVVAAGAAILTVSAVSAGTSAGAAPSAGTLRSAGTAPSSGTVPAATTTVRLITGDTVTTRTVGGRTAVTFVPATGSSGSYTTMALGTHRYVLPAAARYFARVLDPQLFDVSTASPSSIPVDIAFTGARPTIPGLTVTSSTSTSLHGYVDAAGTAAFGAALTTQWHRDMQAGLTAPATLFGATSIATPSVPAVHPDFPQVTLVITATDTDGSKLRSGFVGLVNTDDARRYVGFVFVSNGQARASVPIGDYSLIGEDDSFNETTFALHTSIATIPDFTVTTNFQRVKVDFRDATVVPAIRTPQPATLSQLSLTWLRTVPHGGLSFGFGFGPGDSVSVAPAPAPVRGSVDWETDWALTGTPADATPYRYDASYDDQGAIPADQNRVFDLAKSARVNANFYTDGTLLTAYYGRQAYYPNDAAVFISLLPMAVPTAQTQYVQAPAQATWLDSYIGRANDDDPFQGIVQDEPRVYPPGAVQRIDWLRGPLAPGVPQPTAASDPFFCAACRNAGRMEIYLAPIVDTTPGHQGLVDDPDPGTPVTNFTLYRDGVKIDSVSDGTGDTVRVPAGDADYRAVVQTDLGDVGYLKSTHAVTELTFRSGGGEDGRLPASWICELRGGDCQVLSLLTAAVPLPTDLTGTLPLGTSSFVFTIDGAAGGPAPAATSATMSIQVGDGSYRTVPVTSLGGGRFRAVITHSSADAGQLVSLHVAGTNGSGDGIDETITDAYAVANS